MSKHNSPGGPTNTPQHILDQRPLPADAARPRRPLADGSPDAADPHPSNEEHPYRAPNPGRSGRPVEGRVVGPNNRIHDGTPQPRPKNAENG